MQSDDQIAEALAPLRPISFKKIPIEGRWKKPPFTDRTVADRTMAVVCEDPDISAVVTDRESGEVFIIGPDGAPQLVNSSLERLVACSEVFAEAWRKAMPVNDDEVLAAIAARALAAFTEIDSEAVREKNQLWPVAAEQISYGL